MINSQRNLDQYDPAVAVDAQGRVVVAWANTIRADYSVISSQHFMVGNGPVPAALQVAAAALESVSATPAAPSVVTPAAAAEPPTMVGPVNPPRASAPWLPPLLLRRRLRRLQWPPRWRPYQSVCLQVASPTRSDCFIAGTWLCQCVWHEPVPECEFGSPGQAAASALQQMANLRSSAGARSGGFSARGGHSNRAASLSRGAMMNPARAQSSASRFGQQPGVRSGGFPNRGALASRNSGGIGAVRGLSATLASRNGPQGGLRSGGTAQSRVDQIRPDAQRRGGPIGGSATGACRVAVEWGEYVHQLECPCWGEISGAGFKRSGELEKSWRRAHGPFRFQQCGD